jgi:hypothetical protein
MLLRLSLGEDEAATAVELAVEATLLDDLPTTATPRSWEGVS